MSDTVKLIIEIDKRAYKACQELRTNNDDGIIGLCAVNTIANGTPLNDVKAEIEAYTDAPNLSDSDGVEDGLRLALKIIDKHIGKTDFPQAKDIESTVENFSKVLDNKLIRDATAESEDKE